MTSIRRILLITTLLVTMFNSASAQELIYDIGFETYFDNREYSATKSMSSQSGTDFAARLTPSFGYRFDNDNTLYFGIDAIAPFTEADDDLFDSIELALYYAYHTENWSAAAGMFPRSMIKIESYSTAFFSDDYLFYDNLISGIMGQYNVGDSFIEFACDWESQPSKTTRERFRLLSGARQQWDNLYIGYNLSLSHFAGQDAVGLDNVVDNILLNPRIGSKFHGKYSVDLSVALLQSLQRDRSYENEWLTPAMGEVSLSVSRWGFTLSEEYYFGKDLEPLYDGHILDDGTIVEYADTLYTGDKFFRASGGFYNRATIGYNKSFFDDQLNIAVHFVTHCDGTGLGTEQIFKISLKLGGKIYTIK